MAYSSSDIIFKYLLPFVFNSKRDRASHQDSDQYANAYGAFRPCYIIIPLPPKSNADAQKFYNHIRTTAWYLDAIPMLTQAGLPIRIGLDDIISAIPVWGDLIGLFLALYQVLLCWIFGVPNMLLGRMIFNIVLDLVLGIVPILGDMLDTLFKANLRNLALFEDWLLKNYDMYTIEITPSDTFLPKVTPANAHARKRGR